jgi:Phosphotransferase enzyme family
MTGAADWTSRSVQDLLADPRSRGVLIAASKDPDAKLTFIVTPPCRDGRHGGALEPIAVKIPTTATAGAAVEHEGRMLVYLRRCHLGPIARIVPRYVEMLHLGDRPVLVSTAMTGTPMSAAYHGWMHTARPRAVAADLALAADWLRRFQSATATGAAPLTWAAEVADAVAGRWDGHPALPAALERLTASDECMREVRVRRTAVHGDFWFGNVLVTGPDVTGVVDWEAGAPEGWPLRDLVRFALSYSLYLDRHTRLRRNGFAPGIGYALLGRGWYPRQLRSFVAEGLDRAAVPSTLWYAAALTGIGEVAATANDDGFGGGHLELLAGLPLRARRHRGEPGR